MSRGFGVNGTIEILAKPDPDGPLGSRSSYRGTRKSR